MPERPENLIARFPEHEALVLKLLEEHPKFRTLCLDYEVVASAIERWSRSGQEELLSEVREFQRLFERLERSLQRLLREHHRKG